MGFSELKLLFNKEYRVYLILIIWLLIGFTIYQFQGEIFMIIGTIIFLPLMAITLIFLLVALFFKKRIHEMSFKRLIIHILIALPFMVLIFYIGATLFGLR